jgi:hypothetical protein
MFGTTLARVIAADDLEGIVVRPIIFAAALSVIASPVLAAHCRQPYAPDTNLPAGAGRDAVLQLRQDVQAFITASDVYQQCLIEVTNTDATFKPQADKLTAANQADKQRVGDAFNAIVKQFNAGSIATVSSR